MRAPFLSPASRPSSIWSPPSYPSIPPSNTYPTSTYPPSLTYLPSSPYTSGLSPYAYPKRTRALMPSTRLEQKLSKEDKPWIGEKRKREKASWWVTFVCMLLGVVGSGVLIYFGWTGVHQLKDADLCLVLNEGFNSLDLDNTWTRDVELGGFGNGEFEIATASSENLYIRNNQLYIMPTLTSDETGTDAIFNGGSYDLGDACTAGHDSFSISGTSDSGNCTASSDGGNNVLPPVKSARISTKGHYSIRYGKVEVRAKLPRGDWLWPAIWMLPVNNTYGMWPLSGEIDIMEARGNAQSYAAQGINFVRSSLNYGPLSTVQTHIVGWWQEKRFTYAEDFHTYALEWTPDWMRFYVDTRLQAMINLKITGKSGKSFFDRGGYPATAHNGSDAQVVVSDIWTEEKGGVGVGVASAPFDQEFFLILDLAVGGTSGWFPDGVGDKPWLDGSDSAMKNFALAQDTWVKTWPSNQDDRAFRIDSVKMWSLKSHGKCG
ncbi:concanavalin A-like lectin/glucanase domain-containing protein [Irpex rosettiformis]|uniref:Concanavalin A-like lectin/glucanase domain-containing protein n=1 Tax=Irpex rosettiformis TaxID=378272 RepID=A0ACB8TYV7_9APHY|nr:concanavalin A-like lectin/glucanase domain-containing protein [Irpex rosettiformis]